MEELKISEASVNDAETKEMSGENNSDAKRGKRDYYIELVLFLILGVLLGVAIKTEAVKRVTMGYNDYKMKIMSQDFDINKLQNDILAKEAESAKKEQADGQGEGEQNEATDGAESGQDNQENNNQ